ncbi:hypothetical protein [Mycobacterium sp. NPDC006124]|uniref:hypothetical protein n=1 Tax=Mycobacterium sp. NPDC006124 TaxID=3156729 RepID=UPI0033A700B2
MALETYRYLRGGMAVMIVLLGTAVLIERSRATCWQTSISAYYYTSAHAVFIAALCALGAMLIVYKGSNDTEDVLLNLAGILALIVAMVPTSRPLLLCGPADLDASGSSAIPNTWAVVVALVVSRVGAWWMHRRTGTARSRSALGMAATWTQRLLLAVGMAALVLAPRWFRANAHGVAATAMFAAIIATVAITALVVDAGSYRWVYRSILAAMVLTLAAAVGLHLALDGFNHAVIVVESLLVVEFAAYWMVQTVELWGTTARVGAVTRYDTRLLRAL